MRHAGNAWQLFMFLSLSCCTCPHIARHSIMPWSESQQQLRAYQKLFLSYSIAAMCKANASFNGDVLQFSQATQSFVFLICLVFVFLLRFMVYLLARFCSCLCWLEWRCQRHAYRWEHKNSLLYIVRKFSGMEIKSFVLLEQTVGRCKAVASSPQRRIASHRVVYGSLHLE